MPDPENTAHPRDPKRELKTVGLLWLGAVVLFLGVVTFTSVDAGDRVVRVAAVAAALDLDATAITPAGSALRLPAGANRAVVPAHLPAAASAFPSDRERGN